MMLTGGRVPRLANRVFHEGDFVDMLLHPLSSASKGLANVDFRGCRNASFDSMLLPFLSAIFLP